MTERRARPEDGHVLDSFFKNQKSQTGEVMRVEREGGGSVFVRNVSGSPLCVWLRHGCPDGRPSTAGYARGKGIQLLVAGLAKLGLTALSHGWQYSKGKSLAPGLAFLTYSTWLAPKKAACFYNLKSSKQPLSYKIMFLVSCSV